jgi:hypothetical protein
VSRVNLVLKAIFAGLGAGVGVLVGITAESAVEWSDITVNQWLTALGAFIALFTTVYFVPNTPPAE